jgi:hypothetical protein
MDPFNWQELGSGVLTPLEARRYQHVAEQAPELVPVTFLAAAWTCGDDLHELPTASVQGRIDAVCAALEAKQQAVMFDAALMCKGQDNVRKLLMAPKVSAWLAEEDGLGEVTSGTLPTVLKFLRSHFAFTQKDTDVDQKTDEDRLEMGLKEDDEFVQGAVLKLVKDKQSENLRIRLIRRAGKLCMQATNRPRAWCTYDGDAVSVCVQVVSRYVGLLLSVPTPADAPDKKRPSSEGAPKAKRLCVEP